MVIPAQAGPGARCQEGVQPSGALWLICIPRVLWNGDLVIYGHGYVSFNQPLDFYNENIDDFEFHLLDFWPEPGRYVFKLKCVGKNQKSAGYSLGLESVRLRERRPRVLEYGHFKDEDWRKQPRLFR